MLPSAPDQLDVSQNSQRVIPDLRFLLLSGSERNLFASKLSALTIQVVATFIGWQVSSLQEIKVNLRGANLKEKMSYL